MSGILGRVQMNAVRERSSVQLSEDIAFLTDRRYVPVFDALDAAVDAQIKRLTVTDMLSMGNTKAYGNTLGRNPCRRAVCGRTIWAQ